MAQEEAIKLFDAKQIRVVWDSETEKYYFSIIDVVQVLTETDRPRKYWSDLKTKLQKEGSEVSEKIGQLRRKSRRSVILKAIMRLLLLPMKVGKWPMPHERTLKNV